MPFPLCPTPRAAVALKCWRCTSDAANGKFCGDPFEPAKLKETELRAHYVDCVRPPAKIDGVDTTNYQATCKKMQQQGECARESFSSFCIAAAGGLWVVADFDLPQLNINVKL